MVPGGRHETLMDTPATQARLFAMICDFYADPGNGAAAA